MTATQPLDRSASLFAPQWIEGNRVAGAGVGINLDAGKNLTLGNTAFSNGANYVIAAGNYTATSVTTEAAMNTATNSNFNLSIP